MSRRTTRWWWRNGPARVGDRIRCVRFVSYRDQHKIEGKTGQIEHVHVPLSKLGHYYYGVRLDDGAYHGLYPFQFEPVDAIDALARLVSAD